MKRLLILGLLATVVSIPFVNADVPQDVRQQLNYDEFPVTLTVYDLPLLNVYAFIDAEISLAFVTPTSVFNFSTIKMDKPVGWKQLNRQWNLSIGYKLNYHAVKPPSNLRIRSFIESDTEIKYRC